MSKLKRYAIVVFLIAFSIMAPLYGSTLNTTSQRGTLLLSVPDCTFCGVGAHGCYWKINSGPESAAPLTVVIAADPAHDCSSVSEAACVEITGTVDAGESSGLANIGEIQIVAVTWSEVSPVNCAP